MATLRAPQQLTSAMRVAMLFRYSMVMSRPASSTCPVPVVFPRWRGVIRLVHLYSSTVTVAKFTDSM